MKTVIRTRKANAPTWDAAEFKNAQATTSDTGVSLRDSGKAEMAAVEGVDIHWETEEIKAGRLLPNASIEEWTRAAGMEFLIRKAPVRYYADRGQTDLRTMDSQVVLQRSGTGEALGIVSPDYNIVQPYQVLEFFRDLVAGNGFQLTTAGTLFGGKKFWALAKVTQAKLSGWDEVGAFVLLTTSADGSSATEGRKTTVCVVCRNTLRMANRNNAAKASVSHRVRFDDAKLKAELGLAHDDFQQFMDTANKLTKVKVSTAAADDFIRKLLQGGSAQEEVQAQVAAAGGDDSFASLLARPFTPADIEFEQPKRNPRGLETILSLFDGEGMGATQKGRAGTAWGLVNAVTEYVDHHTTAKTADHRFARAQYGTGDALKVAALEAAVTQYL